MSKKKYRTDYLFPKSNFLIGMGSVLDLSGSYYTFNISETEKEADRKAIESDWGMVGQDMKQAMGVSCKDINTK
jgi:hypothetical protein